jgi:hypothetical protein
MGDSRITSQADIVRFDGFVSSAGIRPAVDVLLMRVCFGEEPGQATIDAREPSEPPVGYGPMDRSIIPESHFREATRMRLCDIDAEMSSYPLTRRPISEHRGLRPSHDGPLPRGAD